MKTFKTAFITLILPVIFIGAYESLTQNFRPDSSILNLLHRYEYLTEYAVVYEPSKGIWHNLGWTGSGMMALMMLYSVRKRVAAFSSLGSLAHWLNAHIFLGIMGSILVTFHTTFKLGGIISTAFWCMVVTVIFGILGRYIYSQIPRNITGAELQASDIDRMVDAINYEIASHSDEIDAATLFKEIEEGNIDDDANPLSALIYMVRTDIVNSYKVYRIKKILRNRYHLNQKMRVEIADLVRKKAGLIRRKSFLSVSHQLLHYWHVFHIPLAIVMFMIMFLHIAVYFVFGTT